MFQYFFHDLKMVLISWREEIQSIGNQLPDTSVFKKAILALLSTYRPTQQFVIRNLISFISPIQLLRIGSNLGLKFGQERPIRIVLRLAEPKLPNKHFQQL